MPADDNGGRKPYKTYKAGRVRRTPVDDELAGARPSRRPRQTPDDPYDRPGGDGAALAAASDKAYRRYEAPSGGRSSGRVASPRRRRRFRWWFIPVSLLVAVAFQVGVVVLVRVWAGRLLGATARG